MRGIRPRGSVSQASQRSRRWQGVDGRDKPGQGAAWSERPTPGIDLGAARRQKFGISLDDIYSVFPFVENIRDFLASPRIFQIFISRKCGISMVYMS
jgi:hypothetical protein